MTVQASVKYLPASESEIGFFGGFFGGVCVNALDLYEIEDWMANNNVTTWITQAKSFLGI